ncbi:MAG TPA: hypothetical protein VGA52_00850 [Anaerolineales bacterium]|jgi:hypothetical protein
MPDGPGSGHVIRQATRYLFPLLLIPYMRGSHTRGMIGLRRGSPIFLKDIKAAQSQCQLVLTPDGLRCDKLFPRWLLIEIPLTAITSVRQHPHVPELLEVRYDQASKGRLLRFVTSGTPGAVPQGVVYFNLGDQTADWLRQIRQLTAARQAIEAES